MKQTLRNKINLIPLSLGVVAITTGMGSLQAKTINAETGPIFNQFFADIQCQRAAVKLNGEWNGQYWTQPGTVNGVCQVVVPDPVIETPFKRPPIRPTVNILSVDAGRLRNEAHANTVCNQLAEEKRGRWNGNWSEKTETNPSYCQIEVAINPPVPPPTYKIINVNTDRIWSPAHAERLCTDIASDNDGTWTGKWDNNDGASSCQIKVPMTVQPQMQPPPPVKPVIKAPRNERNIREVSAGTIRDQNQANRRCERIAEQINAEWTGAWRKTGDDDESVCQMKFQGSSERAGPAAKNAREIAAGPIWDQAQASKKCPLIAAQANSSWTGNWHKIDFSTNQSVCEVTSGPASAVSTTETVVTTSTTYVNLPPPPPPVARNVREIFAGPIWDINQARTKCPMIAANNNGTWTGKWRKTGPDNSSLCEVSF